MKFIQAQTAIDQRGSIYIVEAGEQIPFEIKRIFWVSKLHATDERGNHALRKTKEIVFCVRGSCYIEVDDGKDKSEVFLDSPGKGLLIPPLTWRKLHKFTQDAIMLVVTNSAYDEDEYIWDYDEFKKYAQDSI